MSHFDANARLWVCTLQVPDITKMRDNRKLLTFSHHALLFRTAESSGGFELRHRLSKLHELMTLLP